MMLYEVSQSEYSSTHQCVIFIRGFLMDCGRFKIESSETATMQHLKLTNLVLVTRAFSSKNLSHYIFIRMTWVDLSQRAISTTNTAGHVELRSRAKRVSYGVPERGEGCGCVIEQWREKSWSQSPWEQAAGRLHVARAPLLPSKTSIRLHNPF